MLELSGKLFNCARACVCVVQGDGVEQRIWVNFKGHIACMTLTAFVLF